MFQFRFRFILWVNNFPGHFSPPIIVGVIVTDPDPTLPVVMLLVLPCLIIIAINNMTMWTLTGGILGRATKRGPWVFLVMVPLFIVNVTVVTLVTREFCHSATGNRGRADDRLTRRITEACCWGICNRRRGGCQRFNQHLVDKVMHRRRQTVLTTRHRRGQIVQTMTMPWQIERGRSQGSRRRTPWQRSTRWKMLSSQRRSTSWCQPSRLQVVFGDQRNMFIVPSQLWSQSCWYSSPVSSFSFQDWCQSNWSETAIGKAALCNFKATNTTAACFSSSSGNAAVKEIQQCDQDKSFFRVLLLVVFLVFNLASLLASLRLNRILNYVELYKISKIYTAQCSLSTQLSRTQKNTLNFSTRSSGMGRICQTSSTDRTVDDEHFCTMLVRKYHPKSPTTPDCRDRCQPNHCLWPDSASYHHMKKNWRKKLRTAEFKRPKFCPIEKVWMAGPEECSMWLRALTFLGC